MLSNLSYNLIIPSGLRYPKVSQHMYIHTIIIITDRYGENLERDEFMSYMGERTHEWPSHLDVIEAFKVFDHEGQGYIKTSQLKKLMQSAQLGVDENASEMYLVSVECEC